MKKTLFILIALFTINVAFSQTNDGLMLCNTPSAKKVSEKGTSYVISTTIKQLIECSEIFTKSSDFKIKSFSLGMLSGEDYISVTTDGYRLSDRMIALIQKNQPKRIYVEKINLINGKGEVTKSANLTLNIK
ncbi:MAG: hypothetical protein ACPGSL_09395 [Vicingaceae bacterium]